MLSVDRFNSIMFSFSSYVLITSSAWETTSLTMDRKDSLRFSCEWAKRISQLSIQKFVKNVYLNKYHHQLRRELLSNVINLYTLRTLRFYHRRLDRVRGLGTPCFRVLIWRKVSRRWSKRDVAKKQGINLPHHEYMPYVLLKSGTYRLELQMFPESSILGSGWFSHFNRPRKKIPSAQWGSCVT